MFYDLNSESPKIDQPKNIKIKLKDHQKTCVQAMIDLEEAGSVSFGTDCLDNDGVFSWDKSRQGFTNIKPDDVFELETTCGILGDKVGAGKSYMILSLITMKPSAPIRNKTLLGCPFYNVKLITSTNAVKTNLLVVPHNLTSQWAEFITASKLKYVLLNKASDFKKYWTNDVEVEDTVDTSAERPMKASTKKKLDNAIINIEKVAEIKKYDLVILNINRYKDYFAKIFASVRWGRVIIDEVDTISLPKTFEFECNFFWGITATPVGIFTRRQGFFIESIFKSSRYFYKALIVKNHDDFVDRSLSLPPVKAFMFTCHLAEIISMVQGIMPQNVLEMINAGDMKSAIRQLNCGVETDKDLIEVLTDNLKRQLHNQSLELESMERMEVVDAESHAKRVKNAREGVNSLKTQLKSITDRINGIESGTCDICLDAYKIPTLVKCCKNILCFECLANSLNNKPGYGPSTCPYCRTPINGKESYTVIDNTDKIEQKAKEIKKKQKQFKKGEKVGINYIDIDKKDVLKNILQNINAVNPKSKILIFSGHNETFDHIKDVIVESQMGYAQLSGTIDRINNIIEDYEKGNINVLLLNAEHYGAGFNLQMSDYVIMYHRLDAALEKQVVGRANRLGRNTSLRLVYLVQSNENLSSEYEIINVNNSDEISTMLPELGKKSLIKSTKNDIQKKMNALKKTKKQESDSSSNSDSSSSEEEVVAKKSTTSKKNLKMESDSSSEEEPREPVKKTKPVPKKLTSLSKKPVMKHKKKVESSASESDSSSDSDSDTDSFEDMKKAIKAKKK